MRHVIWIVSQPETNYSNRSCLPNLTHSIHHRQYSNRLHSIAVVYFQSQFGLCRIKAQAQVFGAVWLRLSKNKWKKNKSNIFSNFILKYFSFTFTINTSSKTSSNWFKYIRAVSLIGSIKLKTKIKELSVILTWQPKLLNNVVTSSVHRDWLVVMKNILWRPAIIQKFQDKVWYFYMLLNIFGF